MLNYLLEFLIMAGLGLILYLVARALPRVSDIDTAQTRHIPVPHWAATYLERFDEYVIATLEKLIRRFRLWVLKFDNALLGRLERFRRPTTGGRTAAFPGKNETYPDESLKAEGEKENPNS